MKVLLINGSPNEKGCTFTALNEVAGALGRRGIETEIFWIGKKAIHGCAACMGCTKLGRCVFGDDGVNGLNARAGEFDGLVIGAPVYYAGPNGSMCAFMERLFFSGGKADLHAQVLCLPVLGSLLFGQFEAGFFNYTDARTLFFYLICGVMLGFYYDVFPAGKNG